MPLVKYLSRSYPIRSLHCLSVNLRCSKAGISYLRREVSLLLLEDARVGGWVIVHAGFAIQTIDEARQTSINGALQG